MFFFLILSVDIWFFKVRDSCFFQVWYFQLNDPGYEFYELTQAPIFLWIYFPFRSYSKH